MQRAFVASAVLVIGLVSASMASAQNNMPADFLKARDERTAAIAKGDRAAFDRLTTANFIVTDPAGKVENKAERGARVVPPTTPPPANAAAHENETASLYNNDTIVLHWTQSQGGGAMHFTETWVKDGGQWKVAGVHLSRIAAAPAAR